MIQCLEEWDKKKATVTDRRIQISSKEEAKQIKYDVLLEAAKMVLCPPGKITSTEQVGLAINAVD
jgi:hypothetical protein